MLEQISYKIYLIYISFQQMIYISEPIFYLQTIIWIQEPVETKKFKPYEF